MHAGDAATLAKLRGQYLPAVQPVAAAAVLPGAMQAPVLHARHAVAPVEAV